MDMQTTLWIIFWVLITSAFFADLIILGRHKKGINIKEAGKLIAVWISLALLFGVLIFALLGQEKALEYFTGYAVEYSLSIDNMFVIIMIFSFFKITPQYQHKVLIYGILGAVFLRFLFIFAGIKFINSFSWAIYVFGAILLWTSIKMFAGGKEEGGIENNKAFKILKKVFPLKPDIKSGDFFERENGVLYATPLFAAVIVIEASDIIFAVDSIPAVLSITTDSFIVYSSNIFAVLGLRSLYFMLAGLADRFQFLRYGVALILFFVGAKMLLSHYYHISSFTSLALILSILAASIIISVKKTK
jgi:tellurite resistance protein TerC